MKTTVTLLLLMAAQAAMSTTLRPESSEADSTLYGHRGTTLSGVVITGARTPSDIRHLSQTVSVVNRDALTAQQRVNVLPTLAEEVPGLFVTSRGLMGFGSRARTCLGSTMR